MNTLNIVEFVAIVILPIWGVWWGHKLSDAHHNQDRLVDTSARDVRDRAVCDEADMGEVR